MGIGGLTPAGLGLNENALKAYTMVQKSMKASEHIRNVHWLFEICPKMESFFLSESTERCS